MLPVLRRSQSSPPQIERTHRVSKRQIRRLKALAPYPINCRRRLDFSNTDVDDINEKLEIVISLA